jgi:hypothetical protein
LAPDQLCPSRRASLTRSNRIQCGSPDLADIGCGPGTRVHCTVLTGLEPHASGPSPVWCRRRRRQCLTSPSWRLRLAPRSVRLACLSLPVPHWPVRQTQMLSRHLAAQFPRQTVFLRRSPATDSRPAGLSALAATYLRSRPMLALLRDVVPSSWTTRWTNGRLGCPERPRLTLPVTCLPFREACRLVESQ